MSIQTYHGMDFEHIATIAGLDVGAGSIGGAVAGLPEPLLYYSFDSFGASLADEMGLLDIETIADLKTATGFEGAGIEADTVPGSCRVATNATFRNFTNTLVSFWVYSTSGNTFGIRFYNTAGDLQLNTVGAIVSTGSWHHVLVSFPGSGAPVAYVSVDGGSRSEQFATETVQWSCPGLFISTGVVIDELAILYLAEEPTASQVQQYAVSLYNGGAGTTYRTATGWV